MSFCVQSPAYGEYNSMYPSFTNSTQTTSFVEQNGSYLSQADQNNNLSPSSYYSKRSTGYISTPNSFDLEYNILNL